MNLNEKARLLSEQAFIGFQPEDFERGGREQFVYMLRAGLNPDSSLVDIGCGVLRAGYWLLHFLDPGCYFGIEPHVGRLEMGMHTILEPGLLEAKRPRFHTNADFDTSVFGEKFDFFLAYSIWTHASKRQIELTLESFVRDAKDTGVFLTSYLPADSNNPDYLGDHWFGTSHESNVPGCIHHASDWIRSACESRDLIVSELEPDRTYGMSWLEIRRHI